VPQLPKDNGPNAGIPDQEHLLEVPGLFPVPEPSHEDPPFAISLLALSQIRGLGLKGLRGMVGRFGEGLGRAWRMEPSDLAIILAQAKVPGATRLAQEIHASKAHTLNRGQDIWSDLSQRQITLLGPDQLPSRLRDLPDRPLWLFVQGDPGALRDGPHVAVVGTRNASIEGIRATDAVVRTMSAYPIVLVSGLAEGIDAAAHTAALRDCAQASVATAGDVLGEVVADHPAAIGQRRLAPSSGDLD
jgi:predicted Rossmann fold nucleotide-binding protein DprA/Smf involved in DNA uptake